MNEDEIKERLKDVHYQGQEEYDALDDVQLNGNNEIYINEIEGWRFKAIK